MIKPLKYVSVREMEFWDAVNYLAALDPKSVSLTNCLSYIRRRSSGVSLVNAELVAPWDLPSDQVLSLAIAVTAYVNTSMGRVSKYADVDNLVMPGWWADLKLRVQK